MFEPIIYKNKDPKPEFDDARKAEAAKFYELHLDCQIMAEWFKALAESPPPWYPAEAQLEDWCIKERLGEAGDRPDLRLKYMLEGISADLPVVAFRDMPADLQANLLDRIRLSSAKLAVDQIRMFDASSLMVHTDRAKRYDQLVGRIDWNDNSPATKAFLATVITSCLELERHYEDDNGATKFHERPINPLRLLQSINALDYVKLIKPELLAEVMIQRLDYFARKKTFEPDDDIRIIPIESMLEGLPSSSFKKIFDTIREQLGFPERKKAEGELKLDEPLAEGWQAPAGEEPKPGEGDSPKAP
ncbi:MAG: hypothetical protein PHC70_00530 [Patescibacteria group bacterium]|nr:hypothetical protein [Patescibacteria group bacterium]